jgi:hypothetical protein
VIEVHDVPAGQAHPVATRRERSAHFELGGREFDIAAAGGRTVEDPWLGVPDITRAYRELGFRPIYPTAKAAWRDGAL